MYDILDVVTDLLKGTAVPVSDLVKIARQKICTRCDHMNKTLRVCGICHCALDAKTVFADSGCPDNPPRWNPIPTECLSQKGRYQYRYGGVVQGPFETSEICECARNAQLEVIFP